MVMIRLLLVLFTFIFLGSSYSQDNFSEVDQRIVDYLGEKLVTKIQTERPSHFKYYNYLLNNSYELIDLNVAEQKNIEFESISSVTCIDYNKNSKIYSSIEVNKLIKDKQFNLLTSSLKRNKNTVKYYRLLETNTIIALEPESTVTTNYKKS